MALFTASPEGVIGTTDKWWTDQVQKRTDGKLQVKMFLGEALFKSADIPGALTKGLVEIGEIYSGYYPDKFPLYTGFTVPGVTHDAYALGRALNELWETEKALQDEFHKANMELLYPIPMTSHELFTTKTAVRKADDMKGLMIRATGDYAVLVKALGATPVNISSPEVYAALQKGTIQGIDWAIDSMYKWKLWEVGKYLTLVHFGAIGANGVFMSLNEWNKLTADQRAVFTALRHETIEYQKKLLADSIDSGVKAMKDNGMEVINLPPEEMAKITSVFSPVWENYIKNAEAKGVPGRQHFDLIKQAVKKYGG